MNIRNTTYEHQFRTMTYMLQSYWKGWKVDIPPNAPLALSLISKSIDFNLA